MIPDLNAALNRYRNIPVELALDSTASEVCKRLQSVFMDFMESLNPDEEVGIALTSFGAVRQVAVVNVRSMGPNLLVIDGFEDERRVTLLQHVSQLNFLLVPLKTASGAETPRRKIGFQAE